MNDFALKTIETLPPFIKGTIAWGFLIFTCIWWLWRSVFSQRVKLSLIKEKLEIIKLSRDAQLGLSNEEMTKFLELEVRPLVFGKVIGLTSDPGPVAQQLGKKGNRSRQITSAQVPLSTRIITGCIAAIIVWIFFCLVWLLNAPPKTQHDVNALLGLFIFHSLLTILGGCTAAFLSKKSDKVEVLLNGLFGGLAGFLLSQVVFDLIIKVYLIFLNAGLHP